jgi:fucose permease
LSAGRARFAAFQLWGETRWAQSVGGLGYLVCFILVVLQMFKREKTGIAIVCLVLICCVGGLIAFIFGWIKNKEWTITNIMLIWTVCWIMIIVGYALSPVDYAQFNTIVVRP